MNNGKKGLKIFLLSAICIIMAVIVFFTFARFEMGIKDYNSALGAVQLDYDIAGGVAFNMTISDDNEDEVEDIDAVIKTLEQRLNELGYTSYNIKAIKSTDSEIKDYDIRVEVRETETVSEDMQVVAGFGKVKFFGGNSESESPTAEILSDMTVVKDSKYLGLYAENNYAISIVFEDNAAKELKKLIDAESTYRLKITCGENENGDENVLFDTTITTAAFDGNTLGITGLPSEADAQRLALQIRSGGLNYKYDLEALGTVTSPYGSNVATKSVMIMIVFLVCAIVCLMASYKGLGLIPSLSLIIFLLAETWLLIGVPGIVVSMGGIVGIMASSVLCLISLGGLTDGIKKAFANSGRTVKSAIIKGFTDALFPTFSTHVVAGAVAIALLIFTGGIVKGFAITFGIGVAVSLIVTLVITRMFNSLIVPIAKYSEKFLGLKRAEKQQTESEVEEA